MGSDALGPIHTRAGTVDKGELLQLLLELDLVPALDDEAVDAFLAEQVDKADTNADGKIDFAECTPAWRWNPPAATVSMRRLSHAAAPIFTGSHRLLQHIDPRGGRCRRRYLHAASSRTRESLLRAALKVSTVCSRRRRSRSMNEA